MVEVAELVLKYVQALVWPVVTLGLVWGLRSQLRAALTRMTRVETPAGAIEFAAEAREVLDQAQEAADAVPPAERFAGTPDGFGYPGPSFPWTPVPETLGAGPVPPRYDPAAPAPAVPQQAEDGSEPPVPTGAAVRDGWERQIPEGSGSQQPVPVPVPADGASVEDVEEAEAEVGDGGEGAVPGREGAASPGTSPEGMPQPAGPGEDQGRDYRLAPPLPPEWQPQAPAYGQFQPYGQPPAYPAPEYAGRYRQLWQEELREARAMIDVSPVAAVVSAWNALDRLCLDVVADVSVVPDGAGRPAVAGVVLAAAGLSRSALGVYDRLRLLRDRAVHGAGDVTTGAARDFVDSCRAVAVEVAALRRA